MSGLASAASDLKIDNKYLDENGQEISSAQVGDVVTYEIDVSNEGDTAAQNVEQNSGDQTTSNIDWDAEKPEVSQGKIVGYETEDWYWDIGTLQSGATAILLQKIIPLSTGSEVYYENVYENDIIVATSAAAFAVTSPSTKVKAKTVGMQSTGGPFVPLIFALVLVLGGFVVSKKQ
jgi:hypothetical protein